MHWLKWDIIKQPKYAGGMGFRDLYAFNIAMLAKQGWRLIQKPDSLCAQILRAKYFPHGSVLQAEPRAGISYTWRSILKGVELIKKEMIWRIGNDRYVHIWNDPWIPRGLIRQPSSHRDQNLIQWVSELIDPVNGTWDEELVRQTFHPDDSQFILATPLNEDMDNCIAWHFDPKGMFNVKSAYKVQISHGSDDQGTSARDSFPWKKNLGHGLPKQSEDFCMEIST